MRQFPFIFRILEAVEIQLPKKLDVDALSLILKVSRWHLQHEFKRFTGISVGRYYRLRLLTLAIEAIAHSDHRIIDIALDFGFESQEAFYRAVKQAFNVSPKHFKRDPTLAKLVGIPKIDSTYLQFFQAMLASPPKEEMFESQELVGVQQNFSSVFFNSQTLSTKVTQLWDSFNEATYEWRHEGRQYYVLEYRNNCSGRSGQFQMLAVCDGDEEPSNEPLANIELTARTMWRFSLPNSMYISALFIYLHHVYCYQHKLTLNRLPYVWKLEPSGSLQFRVELKPTLELIDLPSSIHHLGKDLTLKPEQSGCLDIDTIPGNLVQKSQRLAYILEKYSDCLSAVNTGQVQLLIGRADSDGYTTSHDYQVSRFIEEKSDRAVKVEAGKYLKCVLIGTLANIGESLDSLYYSHLTESRYVLVQGFEWITCAEERSNHEWYIELLIPVAKR
ncbi:helix-turn-helix domain-containing protein [Vibrio sp. 99-70-13A1]|uniref:helix-turn-helix domain-containing protein n=1 Tax=Vibrio sp. 99-70-13A1 TaxID=2607601 RepID=UPI001493C38A|nr:helix-turn-helix domain-containing protein [Vibrio sp. 99-70-13A1]NOH97496.1 AraC family transcriptional regulator [Vibrio sp. 99-70-13A1]